MSDEIKDNFDELWRRTKKILSGDMSEVGKPLPLIPNIPTPNLTKMFDELKGVTPMSEEDAKGCVFKMVARYDKDEKA